MARAALLAALALSVLAGSAAEAAQPLSTHDHPASPGAPLRPPAAHRLPGHRLAEHTGPPAAPDPLLAHGGARAERWTAAPLSPAAARRIAGLAASADTLDPLVLGAAGSGGALPAHAAGPLHGAAQHASAQPAAGGAEGQTGGARRLAEFTERTNTTELPVLAAIDASCGRLAVVWCAVKTAGEGPSVYDSYLKVSILSVLDKAPSVLPVLLFDGAADHPLAAWVRDKGGIVIVHSLSFKENMMAAAGELYRWQTTTWLATFSYFDIGLVADQLRALTAGMGVDLANVLYTDVDTIFMQDINSCSLPSPRILSAAGEVTKLTPANAGVIYINLTAWQELHSDLMRYAELNGWIFPNADQEWLFSFFGDRVSVLPDTYNWKPYWGHPQAGTWGKAPAVKILHIHGPKFQESLCVLKFLGTYGLTDASNATLLAKIKSWCKYERSQYSMQLLLDANKVDGGRFYTDAHQLFFRYLAKVRILGRPDEYWELVNGGPKSSRS